MGAGRGGELVSVPDTEVLLDYSREIRPQTESWSCGPGAAEIVLDSLGVKVSERQLIKDIGTTTNGTDFVGLIVDRALNKYDPAGQWQAVYLPTDPATPAQKEALWDHIEHSIVGNRRGLVTNLVVPPWNRPKVVPPSTIEFNYPNAWVWHYTAIMGKRGSRSAPKDRACWMADSGFSPGGGWVSFDWLATAIPPKGYAWASAPVAPKPEPPKPGPVDFSRTDIEWRATQYGDQDAVAAIVAAAKLDNRGRAALALLERVNPAALQAFITKG